MSGAALATYLSAFTALVAALAAGYRGLLSDRANKEAKEREQKLSERQSVISEYQALLSVRADDLERMAAELNREQTLRISFSEEISTLRREVRDLHGENATLRLQVTGLQIEIAALRGSVP